MRNIEIDFDVHKVIELNRNGFEESPNDVLRRLLNLSGVSLRSVADGRPYTYRKMELEHGTEARMTYNGVQYSARIDDGFWVTEAGERHKSPSGAASSLAVTKSGGKTKLDGWSYWEVKRPGSSDWVHINEVWRQSQSRKQG